MKKIFGVVLSLTVLLTACTGAPSAPTTESSISATPSKPSEATLPVLKGLSYEQAHAALVALGINSQFVAFDGSAYASTPGPELIVESTNLESGSKVPIGNTVIVTMSGTKAEIQASANAMMAVRYEYSCSSGSGYDSEGQTFHSAEEIWKSKEFSTFSGCNAKIAGEDSVDYGEEIELLPAEDAVVTALGKNGGDISSRASAFADVLEACTLAPAIDWGTKFGSSDRGIKAIAIEALKRCPKAPFAGELRRVANGIPPAIFDDGTYVVGKSIQAGTYQIQVPEGANGVHDCYWERTNSTGGTLENDFISFAPQGPSVTLSAGEGFVSRDCGRWKKLG